jgi:hypothetical protein
MFKKQKLLFGVGLPVKIFFWLLIPTQGPQGSPYVKGVFAFIIEGSAANKSCS